MYKKVALNFLLNIIVHNSVQLDSNTANWTFKLHRVAYYVKTTKLSCDCY
jgi:hypothetical protein